MTTEALKPTAFRRRLPGSEPDPRAVAAGKKSAEVRARRKEAQAAQAAEAEALKTRFLNLDLSREELGPASFRTAALIIQRIALEMIPIRNGAEAAALVDKLHAVGRLESGQVTTLQGRVTLQLDEDEVRARIAGVRASIDPHQSVAVSSDTVTPQVSGPAPALDIGTPAPAYVDVEFSRDDP